MPSAIGTYGSKKGRPSKISTKKVFINICIFVLIKKLWQTIGFKKR